MEVALDGLAKLLLLVDITLAGGTYFFDDITTSTCNAQNA